MHKLLAEELNRLSVDEFKRTPKLPLVVVLDNIRSLHNVGAVFRTSDAFRVAHIYLCGITACPPSAEIHKTALGAEDAVEWTYCADTLEAVSHLLHEGYHVLAAEQVEGSTPLHQFQPDAGRRYAIVLGNEVKGVAQNVVDACTGCLEIPQFGTKHSLNVSVSAGILIWEMWKKLAAANGQ